VRFRKKPVIIDAMQFDGTHACAERIVQWVNQSTGYSPEQGGDPPILFYYGIMTIRTLEGNMTGSKGDWIIRGVKGEFYPCKPDIFEATYEREGAA
jgi:hypothetical protein